MTEPVTLADFKAHLRLDQGVTGEDDNLSLALLAARRKCELETNRSIVGTSRVLTIDTFPGTRVDYCGDRSATVRTRDIALPGGSVGSVTSISYMDHDRVAQTMDPACYTVALSGRPAVISPVDQWPETADQAGAIQIEYVVLPLENADLALVRQAILLIAANWYENREGAVVDMRGTPAELPLSVSWILESLWQPSTS